MQKAYRGGAWPFPEFAVELKWPFQMSHLPSCGPDGETEP